MKMSDPGLRAACQLLGVYTGHRYDIWMLAGPQKANYRARVMSMLMGRRMPQSKSGVHAIKDEMYKRIGVEADCMAGQDDTFIAFCQHEFAENTCE